MKFLIDAFRRRPSADWARAIIEAQRMALFTGCTLSRETMHIDVHKATDEELRAALADCKFYWQRCYPETGVGHGGLKQCVKANWRKDMGWSLEIKADKAIKREDVETVLDNAIFVGWGWKSMGVDISLPKGKTMGMSGALYSLDCAKPAARKIKEGLKKLGYKVTASKVS